MLLLIVFLGTLFTIGGGLGVMTLVDLIASDLWPRSRGIMAAVAGLLYLLAVYQFVYVALIVGGLGR